MPLLAVQGWDEVDDFVDYLWRWNCLNMLWYIYIRLKRIALHCRWTFIDLFNLYSFETRYPEEKDEDGRTLYGGMKDGALVGGTKVSQFNNSILSGIFTPMFWSPQVYLGSDFRSLLTGMVSIDARGRVGMQEVSFYTSAMKDKATFVTTWD